MRLRHGLKTVSLESMCGNMIEEQALCAHMMGQRAQVWGTLVLVLIIQIILVWR